MGTFIQFLMACFSAVTILSVFVDSPRAHASCDPEVSKPCGQTCIKKTFKCHKNWTTQTMGQPGQSTKKTYDNPKHVDTPPTEESKK